MRAAVGLGAREVVRAEVGRGAMGKGEGRVVGEPKVLHESWDVGRFARGF